MKRNGTRIFWTVVLTGLISLALCNLDNAKATPEKNAQLPQVKVSVQKAQKSIAKNQIEIVGTVQAVEQAEIAAKISGNIIKLPVDLGTRVHKGDLLVEIRAEEISAKLQQAKAQLEQARRNLAREEKLLKKKAATLETVKSLRDMARIAEAAHREARIMLGYTKIVAPFTGIVTRKLTNIGDLATPGKPLLTIEEENNLQVLTDIPEAMILKINKGDSLPVFIPSVNLTITGKVAEVAPTADPFSRTAPIKLKIPTDPGLRSGQFARVTLALAAAETLTVPESAVTNFGQIERIFVVENGKAELRIVRTGNHSGNSIEILSGLKENEAVIISDSRTLVDGQPVTIQ
jgi:RND family efflux transporter MFP subunit